MLNTKKVAIDAARRRWLHKHRQLFEPLLPSSNAFFSHLEKDIQNSSDKGLYVPLHEIVEQPKLIAHGHLKDYQVCRATC